MNALLVDDEPSNIENLAALLGRHCPQVRIMGTAATISGTIDLLEQHRPDLVFLDIQLKNETGFDLLKRLPEPGFEVIFVTAYDQYGIHAIKFAALDYLLKPVDIDELKSAVERAGQTISKKHEQTRFTALMDYLKHPSALPQRIALPMMNETRYVAVADIIRCEADNTYTWFFLQNGEKTLVSRTLKEHTDLLAPYGFIRSHQSHLVNPDYVMSWLKEDGGVLLLKNHVKIPVSKPNRERVRAALGH